MNNIEISHIDFIGIYKNVISKDICEKFVNNIDKFFSDKSNNMTHGAGQFANNELGRLDYSTNGIKNLPNESKIINDALLKCIEYYVNQYFVIRQLPIVSNEVKIQKTPPRGGYHRWHCESCTIETSHRALAWMVYLNDIPENEGETEFIWQKLRVNPEAGKFLIWPAQFTHTHRGNPVYSCDKYIATGWFTFVNKNQLIPIHNNF
jgi:hypothetical protein